MSVDCPELSIQPGRWVTSTAARLRDGRGAWNHSGDGGDGGGAGDRSGGGGGDYSDGDGSGIVTSIEPGGGGRRCSVPPRLY